LVFPESIEDIDAAASLNFRGISGKIHATCVRQGKQQQGVTNMEKINPQPEPPGSILAYLWRLLQNIFSFFGLFRLSPTAG